MMSSFLVSVIVYPNSSANSVIWDMVIAAKSS